MQVWFWLHLTEVTWNRPIYNTETLAAGNQTQVCVFMRTIVIPWASKKMNMSNLLSSSFPFFFSPEAKELESDSKVTVKQRNALGILESFHIWKHVSGKCLRVERPAAQCPSFQFSLYTDNWYVWHIYMCFQLRKLSVSTIPICLKGSPQIEQFLLSVKIVRRQRAKKGRR